MAKQLLIDTLTFRPQMSEDAQGGRMIFRGQFALADVKTANNRVYGRSLWEREIQKLQQPIKENKVYGEVDHPADGRTKLSRAAIRILSLELQEDGQITGSALVMDTASGKDLKAIVDSGGAVGVSSRGYGSVVSQDGVEMVQDDYTLDTFDMVCDPAQMTAYPEVSTESKKPGTAPVVSEEQSMDPVVKKEDVAPKQGVPAPSAIAPGQPPAPKPAPVAAAPEAPKPENEAYEGDPADAKIGEDHMAGEPDPADKDLDEAAKFDKLVGQLKDKGAKDPEALAAWIGRKNGKIEGSDEPVPQNVPKAAAPAADATSPAPAAPAAAPKKDEASMDPLPMKDAAPAPKAEVQAEPEKDQDLESVEGFATQFMAIVNQGLKNKIDVKKVFESVAKQHGFTLAASVVESAPVKTNSLTEEKLAKENNQLAHVVRDLGYTVALMKELGGWAKLSERVKALGTLTKYESVDSLMAAAKPLIEEYAADRRKVEEAKRNEANSLKDEIKTLKDQAVRLIKRNKDVATERDQALQRANESMVESYFEKKVALNPRASQMRVAYGKLTERTKSSVDQLVEAFASAPQVHKGLVRDFDRVRARFSKGNLPASIVEDSLKGTVPSKDEERVVQVDGVDLSMQQYQHLAGVK